jgi:hypothetical protein
MSFSNLSKNNFIESLGFEERLELIMLAYPLHGEKEKTIRQLYALKAQAHSNPVSTRRIQDAIDKFERLSRLRFL